MSSGDICYVEFVATTYKRVRVGWGGIDIATVTSETPQYSSTQYAYAGASAAVGAGVGVRRATLNLNRNAATPPDDAMQLHFDFMNMTSDAPDDTWIAADFTALEARLLTWWTSAKVYCPNYAALDRIIWHRVGPGVVKPNPAERVLEIGAPVVGTATAVTMPQQACSITFRTGIRKSWGRTYLPYGLAVGAAGHINTADVDGIVAMTKTLRDGAASDDFLMGVLSIARNSFLGIEAIEADNVPDVVRRRRWKHTSYRKITPIT